MTEQLASLVPILTGDSVADDRLKHLWPEVKNKKTPKNKNPTSYIRTSTQLWLNAPKKKKKKKERNGNDKSVLDVTGRSLPNRDSENVS